MEKFVTGDIVVISFPFSDLSGSKKRPALVLRNLDGFDIILCQITSKNTKDKYSISLKTKEFQTGTLNQDSNIRINKLFTADKSIINYKAGTLQKTKITIILNKVCELIKGK